MSKQNSSKKQRHRYHYFRTAGVVTSLEIYVDPTTGTMSLVDADPRSLRTTVEHERDSGKNKVISSIPVNYHNVNSDTTDCIFTNYDYLYAMDTNTRVINGLTLSACIIYFVKGHLKHCQNPISMGHFMSYLIINPKDGVNPERIGWHIFITNNVIHSILGMHKEILGIVVDSELGRHQTINNREEPYYDSHILPTTTKLLYGSADKLDCLPNILISQCDKGSSDLLDHIESNKMQIPQASNGNDDHDGYFFVYSTQDSPEPKQTVFHYNR